MSKISHFDKKIEKKMEIFSFIFCKISHFDERVGAIFCKFWEECLNVGKIS